jgi:hypothetical protein
MEPMAPTADEQRAGENAKKPMRRRAFQRAAYRIIRVPQVSPSGLFAPSIPRATRCKAAGRKPSGTPLAQGIRSGSDAASLRRLPHGRCTPDRLRLCCNAEVGSIGPTFRLQPANGPDYGDANSFSALMTNGMNSLPPSCPASSNMYSRLVVHCWDSRHAVTNGPLTS